MQIMINNKVSQGVTPVTFRKMAMKISINGKEYRSKDVVKMAVKRECAVMQRHKDTILFESGVVYVKCSDDAEYIWITGGDEKQTDIALAFCNPENIWEQAVYFSDIRFDEGWREVFVYFYDEEGAMFLHTKRFHRSKMRGLFQNVGIVDKETIHQIALHIATNINEDLFKKVDEIASVCNDISMLEVF